MTYSLDFRQLAVRKIQEENETQQAVASMLNIARSTLQLWLQRETLEAAKPGPTTSRLDRTCLQTVVQKEPDLYLDEYAEKLGSKRSTVAYNLQVLNISRKKNHAVRRTK
jgi:predicted transcriptional regulator